MYMSQLLNLVNVILEFCSSSFELLFILFCLFCAFHAWLYYLLQFAMNICNCIPQWILVIALSCSPQWTHLIALSLLFLQCFQLFLSFISVLVILLNIRTSFILNLLYSRWGWQPDVWRFSNCYIPPMWRRVSYRIFSASFFDFILYFRLIHCFHACSF